jgi:hypothetical protein
MAKMRSNRGAKNREVIAKAEQRFAKADRQRARIKANPEGAVRHGKERLRRVKKRAADFLC